MCSTRLPWWMGRTISWLNLAKAHSFLQNTACTNSVMLQANLKFARKSHLSSILHFGWGPVYAAKLLKHTCHSALFGYQAPSARMQFDGALIAAES